MEVEPISRLEMKKLSIQEALPLITQLACSLRAKAKLREQNFKKSTIKYEQIRWELAAYSLRLTREGINRFIVDNPTQFRNINQVDELKRAMKALINYAMPSAVKGLAGELTDLLDERTSDEAQSSFAEMIFNCLMELTWDSLKDTFISILAPFEIPQTLKERHTTTIANHSIEKQEYCEVDDFFVNLFEENYRWKCLSGFFDKYTIDSTTLSITDKLKFTKKDVMTDHTEEFKTGVDLAEEKEKMRRMEAKRLERIQLQANEIISRSESCRLAKVAKRQQFESSAFPNSKAIPVHAIKNVLSDKNSTAVVNKSRFLKLLKEELDKHEDSMDFTEFSKTAVVTQVELSNKSGRSKKLKRLQDLIKNTGKVKNRSLSPTREQEDEDSETLVERKNAQQKKFKARVEIPEKKQKDFVDYQRACTCCKLF